VRKADSGAFDHRLAAEQRYIGSLMLERWRSAAAALTCGLETGCRCHLTNRRACARYVIQGGIGNIPTQASWKDATR